MGWFDTLLSAASAGASIYNASQLQAMRQQGATAASIQALIAHLRDQIFQLKQMAEFALAQEARSAKIAAAAMGIVESRLRTSGIAPDLFPELGDKEYVAQAIRMIEENRRRLLGLLSAEEQNEVARVIATTERLPDYNYYVDNFADGRRLMEVAPTVAKYESRNGCGVTAGFAMVCCIIFLTTGLLAISAVLENATDVIACALTLVGSGVLVGGVVGFVRWQHRGEYGKAKDVVDSLKKKIDLPRFVALDSEFGGEAAAQQLQSEAQNLLSSFFGDSQLLSP